MEKSAKREILKAMIARYSNLKINKNQLHCSIHSDKKRCEINCVRCL
jgi:hypothetical protein